MSEQTIIIEAPTTAPAVEEAPAASQGTIPLPYFTRLVSENPELKPYEATLARFSKPTEAADYAREIGKSYGELAKFKGAHLPAADARPEDIASYRRINGIPEDPSGYKFGEAYGEKFQEMGVNDPNLIRKYEAAAHKHNLTPAQFAGIMEDHGEIVRELTRGADSRSAAEHAEAIGDLKARWGGNFQTRLGEAQKLFDVAVASGKLDSESLSFKNDPKFVEFLHALGTRIPKESSIHAGAAAVYQGDAGRFKTITEAMRADPKHPVLDHTNPGHAAAFEEYVKLKSGADSHYGI